MGLESLKQEAGSEQSWSIVFLGVSCSWEEKKRIQGRSVGLRKGRQPQVLCVRVMSWVPGTSRNTDEFHLWASRKTGQSQGRRGKGAARSYREGGPAPLPATLTIFPWTSSSPPDSGTLGPSELQPL